MNKIFEFWATEMHKISNGLSTSLIEDKYFAKIFMLLNQKVQYSRPRINLCMKIIQIRRFSVPHIQIRSFSGPHFPAFGLNTEIYRVILRIQCKCGKIRTRKNSVFGHFSKQWTQWMMTLKVSRIVDQKCGILCLVI